MTMRSASIIRLGLTRPSTASRTLGKSRASVSATSGPLLRSLSTVSGVNGVSTPASSLVRPLVNSASCSFATTTRSRATNDESLDAAVEDLASELGEVSLGSLQREGAVSRKTEGASPAIVSGEEIVAQFEALRAERGGVSGLTHADFVACLRLLADTRDFPRSLELLKEMHREGGALLPDSEAYSLVLSSVRRTLRVVEIRQLFGDMSDYRATTRSNDSQSTHPERHANRNGESPAANVNSVYFAQVQEVLAMMESQGVRPAMWFYEEFANFLAAGNQGGILVNLATAMEKRGEQPSTRFYNRMLYCLPRCGLVDRAAMLFNRMVLRGTADYYSYLVRVSSLVYGSQAEAARALLADMKGKFPLDAVAHNILIKSYLAQRNIDQAVQVFQQMLRDPATAPNRITCRTFISYFYDSADLTHAESIVKHFAAAGFPETTEDYGNLIKFFARYDPPKVLELVDRLKQAHGGHLPRDDNQIFHAFLRIMNDRQITPDWKRSFASIILATPVSEAGNSILLESCVDIPSQYRELVARVPSPDSSTYEIVLKKLLQLRRYDAAKALYESMFSSTSGSGTHGTHVTIHPVHRNLHLTALLSSNDLDGARNCVAEMHQRRMSISAKNVSLMETMNVELPRGALAVRKGQGVYSVNGGGSGGRGASRHSESGSRHRDHSSQLNII